LSIKSFIASWWAYFRTAAINKIVANPQEAQLKLLRYIISKAEDTIFGKDHHFSAIKTYESFAQQVPVRDYEAFRSYIEMAYAGKTDVLWPGKPLYFAKTSGTTSGAKYIPISRESMPCHIKGARDALFFYITATGKNKFVDGKMIFLSGSPLLEKNDAGIPVGRLSGIAQHYVPKYLQSNRLPTWEINCIEDWESKIDAIVTQSVVADLRLISGIPPWVHMFFERLTAKTGKLPAEIWPNLDLFVQGGVDYAPYSAIITKAFGKEPDVVEVYPASEGFIAVQNNIQDPGLLLMLDYGIFFEFIPLAEYGKPNPTILPLWQVSLDENYAILLTTTAGLFRYDIGDTVRFTSLKPYKIRVSGRVKHFISAFGEHVIQEEVNTAMATACNQTNAVVSEFTVAPYISESDSYHEWFVEFEVLPESVTYFSQILDEQMQNANIYYKDLRKGNLLSAARIRILPPGSVRAYMKSIGKLGGQNKFPRLANHRQIADALSTDIQ
jgi:hypothetical protein